MGFAVGLINFNCGMNYGLISLMPFILKCGELMGGSILFYAGHRTSGMASSDTAGTKIHYVLCSVMH